MKCRIETCTHYTKPGEEYCQWCLAKGQEMKPNDYPLVRRLGLETLKPDDVGYNVDVVSAKDLEALLEKGEKHSGRNDTQEYLQLWLKPADMRVSKMALANWLREVAKRSIGQDYDLDTDTMISFADRIEKFGVKDE